jgi:transposase-like protein
MLELVKQTFEAGMTVSMVARQVDIAPTQLLQRNKGYSEGCLVAIGANAPVHSLIYGHPTRFINPSGFN